MSALSSTSFNLLNIFKQLHYVYLRRGDNSQSRRASRHKTHGRQLASQRCRGCRGAYVMVMEGAEKQAGRLWDNFGNYERSK